MSDWWSGVTDWLGNHAGDILDTGIAIYGQSQKDKSQDQYLDYLRERENQNYQDSVNAINAYNAQLGGGGGGAGAFNATEANRLAALSAANAASQASYKKILQMYKPLRKTVKRLLPQMTKTYENSLGLQGKLSDFIQSPEQMALLNQSGPAWNVNVPLPDYVKIK